MLNVNCTSKKLKGFTLIEVMVVVVLIGIIASSIQFNFFGERPEDVLKKSSHQFAAIFETAADYGLLNNIELGLVVNEDNYQFLGYDGVKWSEIADQDWLTAGQLPPQVEMSLQLDDLPIEEPLLFDSSVIQEQDENDFSTRNKDEKEKKIIPQVYILSGGDITPFSLTFSYNEEASLINDVEDLAYRVSGLYSIPLTIEGPTLDDE
ncbi:type II secretion system minor pseudopilin GspH [Litorilituus lipolyticus]|uniref:Type II secretion system protein H n=1 Tax=Litorilituus lipolyticus TaxID=2491017 RepID=A0A502KXQ4_9GAMM|nr:type II secretion system minor pseudopilin GspH [Litorilituus lipolyticus]TPH15249.1 type II secretion system protein GspH [Litorilituus lipolyticus]